MMMMMTTGIMITIWGVKCYQKVAGLPPFSSLPEDRLLLPVIWSDIIMIMLMVVEMILVKMMLLVMMLEI